MDDKENIIKMLLELLANYATIEQLQQEQNTRAYSDDLINANIQVVTKNFSEYKYMVDALLHDKQEKVALELETNSKVIIGAINEVNSKKETEDAKDYTDIKIKILEDKIKEPIKSLKYSINTLEEQFYKKIKEIELNNTKYKFDEYDENYWYMFIFEFNNMLNKKINGILERPSNLSKDIISQNVLLDYSATSSINMIFSPITKILEAKDWGQVNKKINKIHIYQKKI